jgi:hypothetical protein
MARPVTERRGFSRFAESSVRHLQAVLRPGHPVALVNLGGGGALVDGWRPLRPGSRVFLQLTIDDQMAGRSARVVRATVAALTGRDGVRYRSALSFDEPWETLWEQCTLDGYLVPAAPAAPLAISGEPLPGLMSVTLDVSDGALK